MFRCVVSNDAGTTVSASEMLFVTAARTAPNQITSPIAVSVQVGTPLAYSSGQSGGTDPIAYTTAPLPDGLSIDSASGNVSGIPTTVGDTQVMISATNSAGQTSRTLTVSVTADPPVIPLDTWRLTTFGAS